MADTGKEKSGVQGVAVAVPPPSAPGPNQIVLNAQPGQYPGRRGRQGFKLQNLDSAIDLSGKIVVFAELFIAFLCMGVWIYCLGAYIDGSVTHYGKQSSNYERDYDYGYKSNKYIDSSYYRAGHSSSNSDSYSASKSGFLAGLLLTGVTIGFAIELGLIVTLVLAVFRKSFELCVGWVSPRIALFLFEFIGFVYLCGDYYDWWAILIAVVYLLYRIMSIGAITAIGFNIYRSRNKVNQAQTVDTVQMAQSNQIMPV